MRDRLPSFPSVPIVRFSVSQGLVNASVRSDGVSCNAEALVQDRYGIALCSLSHLLSQWLVALPLVPQQVDTRRVAYCSGLWITLR